MRQLFFLVLLSFALFSMNRQPSGQLCGKWKEIWINDEDIDTDTLEISRAIDEKLMVECLSEKAYQYKDLVFNGKKLDFTMINAKDPADVYTLHYSLKPDKTMNKLEGSAINNKGETGEITLQRIP